MSKINNTLIWFISILSLSLSFTSGVYIQHSMVIIENTKPKPNSEIIKIKQSNYASILSSFEEISSALEENKPTEPIINKIRKSYYEIELFLPKEYRQYMQKSVEKTIVFLTSTPQQKESYLKEKRQLRQNLQNMLELKNI